MPFPNLVVKEGVYVPPVWKTFPTDDPFAKLLPDQDKLHLVFDENFPYLDDSLKAKLKRNLFYLVIQHMPGWFINTLHFGLRIDRSALKPYKHLLKKGGISVSNHCYKFDGLAVSRILRRRLRIPMLKEHITGKDHFLLSSIGGVPLPESVPALLKFGEAFDTFHKRGEWIHIFAEGRCWRYYKPLKPFMKGAFSMAYKYNVPIIPLCINFRPRTGIYRLFGPKDLPLVSISAAEPIFPDVTASKRKETERLLVATHKAICELGGIIQNPWPPIWNEV